MGAKINQFPRKTLSTSIARPTHTPTSFATATAYPRVS